jgi:hypothetical protein
MPCVTHPTWRAAQNAKAAAKIVDSAKRAHVKANVNHVKRSIWNNKHKVSQDLLDNNTPTLDNDAALNSAIADVGTIPGLFPEDCNNACNNVLLAMIAQLVGDVAYKAYVNSTTKVICSHVLRLLKEALLPKNAHMWKPVILVKKQNFIDKKIWHIEKLPHNYLTQEILAARGSSQTRRMPTAMLFVTRLATAYTVISRRTASTSGRPLSPLHVSSQFRSSSILPPSMTGRLRRWMSAQPSSTASSRRLCTLSLLQA